MSNASLLNDLLETISFGTTQEAMAAPKSWPFAVDGEALFVNDIKKYMNILNELYIANSKVQEAYSRNTFFKELESTITTQKRNKLPFPNGSEKAFYSRLLGSPPRDIAVFSPVSGIMLSQSRELEVGPFTIKKFGPDDLFAFQEKCLHIGVDIHNSYDVEQATTRATSMFNDFSRIVHFLIGRFDNGNIIKIGLPLLPIVGDRVYSNTDSFSVVEGGQLGAASIKSQYFGIIPIDNSFFTHHESFVDLWRLLKIQNDGEKITDMQRRILGAAIAVGESAKSTDLKNSIIYSCIALETLFGYNEGALFNSSIGENIADSVSFMTGLDVDTRLHTHKFVKDVYGYRSAIVHGGNKNFDSRHTILNTYTRACIAQFLTNDSYNKITKIEDFYSVTKRMKFSL